MGIGRRRLLPSLPVAWFFASDLHGRIERYETLLARIAAERPEAVLLGGDLLPMHMDRSWALRFGGTDFIGGYLASRLRGLRADMGDVYPKVLVILGNDDPRFQEPSVLDVAAEGLWTYIHGRKVAVDGAVVYGYAFVPPTPFQLKDWERYDVSRYVDPGCVSPEEGQRTVPVSENEQRFATIQKDLDALAGQDDLSAAVMLFHTPPYQTMLDRAALDGHAVDYAPVDVHVGSIAVRRFIEARQPLVTLHGHVHESARITGAWRDRIGRTHLFSAAHDGPELALVRFDAADPASATRELC